MATARRMGRDTNQEHLLSGVRAMFRLLGFIIGSFVSIAALVLMIGVPNFHLVGDGTDENRYEVAIEKLREKQKTVQEAITDLPRELPIQEIVVDEALPAVEEFAEMLGTTAGETVSADETDVQPAPPLERIAATPETPEDTVEPPQIPAEPEWHAFWTPFRSELAAEGFVRRLESVTGLDYRIVKVKNGVYQVAFPYADDSERSTKLSQISAATGLDLSDALR